VAYAIYGGYEGQSSATGFELGKELTFDYALEPHAGDWRQAAPWTAGQAFNQPLLAVTAAPHAGPLTSRWGFLTRSHPGPAKPEPNRARAGARAGESLPENNAFDLEGTKLL
jgi:hypothetical protein